MGLAICEKENYWHQDCFFIQCGLSRGLVKVSHPFTPS